MIHPSDLAGMSFDSGLTRTLLTIGRSAVGPHLLPLIVIRGAPGPKLVVVAAQHGDEGYATLGCHHVAESIDPKTLRGTLWLLPCLNVDAFVHGTRTSPFDRQDMNRVHPGSSAGTITEQVSDAFIRHVLPGADLLIDLHGGSPENGDVAFARWSDVPDRVSLQPLVRSLAIDFALAPGARDVPGMLSGATTAMGVPQIAIEACNGYGRATENAARMAGFILDAMRFMQMIPGIAPLPTETMRLCRTVTHRATTTGVWESFVTFGQHVQAGESVGVIRDLLGERIQHVFALDGGTVAVMRTGTRVHAGETLMTIAVTTDA